MLQPVNPHPKGLAIGQTQSLCISGSVWQPVYVEV